MSKTMSLVLTSGCSTSITEIYEFLTYLFTYKTYQRTPRNLSPLYVLLNITNFRIETKNQSMKFYDQR